MPTDKAKFEKLLIVNAGELELYYQEVIDSEFLNPWSVLKIRNGSNIPILLSFDAIDDHDYIQAGREFVFSSGDFYPVLPKSNDKKVLFSKGTKIYLAYPPTVGVPIKGQILINGLSNI